MNVLKSFAEKAAAEKFQFDQIVVQLALVTLFNFVRTSSEPPTVYMIKDSPYFGYTVSHEPRGLVIERCQRVPCIKLNLAEVPDLVHGNYANFRAKREAIICFRAERKLDSFVKMAHVRTACRHLKANDSAEIPFCASYRIENVSICVIDYDSFDKTFDTSWLAANGIRSEKNGDRKEVDRDLPIDVVVDVRKS
ncbi:hypothetical protein QR680_011900 [Steinernema hermaphroditum]|uniref:Uncharacterized protein n=1 Tax=Steinernema hermaphroditum TaxID=289476 RepID=A0AA39I2M5_9BILA|nr:hypothetical protein QR680_011900 [Steinernema hermaphroditum]